MEILEERRPAMIIRHAWSTMRLNLIHDAVRLTISKLEDSVLQEGALHDGALHDGALQDGALQDGAPQDGAAGDSQADSERRSASQMALAAIIGELRDEAGLGEDAPPNLETVVTPGLHWGLLYSECLERYRTVAAADLHRRLVLCPVDAGAQPGQ